MKWDEQGVAGFFEDLPVLLFILAGTFTVVLSSLSVSATVVSFKEDRCLDLAANRCVDLLVSELLGPGKGAPVMAGSFCATRLHQVAEDFLGTRSFCLGIVMLHPELRWLLDSDFEKVGVPERASSTSRLFNAMTDGGLRAVLVVRLIVW